MINVIYTAVKFLVLFSLSSLAIILCLVVFFLILPTRYSLYVKISEEKILRLKLYFIAGLLPLEFKFQNSKLQTKLFFFDINKKTDLNTQKNSSPRPIDSQKLNGFARLKNKFSHPIHTVHNFFNFVKNDFKNICPPTIEFITFIAKKLHPKKIILDGVLGFDDPSTTGFVCAAENFISALPNKKIFVSNLNYDFNQQISLLNLSFRGKLFPVSFLFAVVKYIRNQSVSAFIKNIA